MAWRNPETLRAYEHYFDEQRHAKRQDQLHRKWYAQDLSYEQETTKIAPEGDGSVLLEGGLQAHFDPQSTELEQGWDTLLALGGTFHA
jgi:hypothetical protein